MLTQTPAYLTLEFRDLPAILRTLTALFGHLNDRWLKQPTVIGIMPVALPFSLLLTGLHRWGPDLSRPDSALLAPAHFGKTLLHGMPGYLLFAGALQIDVSRLRQSAWVITVPATAGTLMATLLIGAIAYHALQWIGLPLPFMACMLLGALFSPTDPLAVLAILQQPGAPPKLELQISGESPFDVGLVLTLFILFFTPAHRHALCAGMM